MALGAAAVGALSATGGLAASLAWDTPAGPSIVVVATGVVGGGAGGGGAGAGARGVRGLGVGLCGCNQLRVGSGTWVSRWRLVSQGGRRRLEQYVQDQRQLKRPFAIGETLLAHVMSAVG